MTDAKGLPNYTKFLFAASAGYADLFLGATLVCFPLDLVKTRMQVSGQGGKSRVTTLNTAKSVIKQEGIRGLYNGISASVLRQATSTGVRYGTFQSLLDYFTEEGKPQTVAVQAGSGVVSGIVGAIAGLPSDVALTRMAADGHAPPDKRRNYKNVFDALYRILKEEGVSVLFRGMNPTVMRAIVLNIAQMISYGQAKSVLVNQLGVGETSNIVYIGCSVYSAFASTCCVLPTDIAKTRLQNMKSINGKPEYSGMINCWYKMIKSEGPTSLWKGFTPYFSRNGPQFIVFFLLYENFIVLYRKYAMEPVEVKPKGRGK